MGQRQSRDRYAIYGDIIEIQADVKKELEDLVGSQELKSLSEDERIRFFRLKDLCNKAHLDNINFMRLVRRILQDQHISDEQKAEAIAKLKMPDSGNLRVEIDRLISDLSQPCSENKYNFMAILAAGLCSSAIISSGMLLALHLAPVAFVLPTFGVALAITGAVLGLIGLLASVYFAKTRVEKIQSKCQKMTELLNEYHGILDKQEMKVRSVSMQQELAHLESICNNFLKKWKRNHCPFDHAYHQKFSQE